jgi:hypothetical protein
MLKSSVSQLQSLVRNITGVPERNRTRILSSNKPCTLYDRPNSRPGTSRRKRAFLGEKQKQLQSLVLDVPKVSLDDKGMSHRIGPVLTSIHNRSASAPHPISKLIGSRSSASISNRLSPAHHPLPALPPLSWKLLLWKTFRNYQ